MSPSLRRPVLATVATSLALAVLLSGCARAKRPGVKLESVQADITFGVKDPEKVVTPAVVAPIVDPAAVTGDAPLPPTVFEPAPGRSSKKDLSFLPPLRAAGGSTRDSCPPAPLNAFPEKEATLNVFPDGQLPEEGLYRWRRRGSLQRDGGTVPVDAFEQRAVRNVKKVADNGKGVQYTFETVQPRLGTDQLVVTSWFVDSNAQSRDVTSPANNARVSGGVPERGVVIRAISIRNAAGEPVAGRTTSFPPGGGLLVLPLPIRAGERFRSAAADAISGNAIQIDGTVQRRARVDACGEIIDGWLVDATLTLGGGATTKYSYIVATQYGGILVQEAVDGTFYDGTRQKVTYTSGQKQPDPLPGGGGS